MRTHTTHTQLNDSVNVKLLILGIEAVGKSSLLLRFTDQQWLPEGEMQPTIGVDTLVMSRNRGQVSRAHTFVHRCQDTAGDVRLRAITSSYYRGTQGIILGTWSDDNL